MTNMQKAIAIAVAMLFFGAFIIAIIASADKAELVECLKLQSYSERYSEFFLTEWQAEMCAHAEVEINAPIIKTNK